MTITTWPTSTEDSYPYVLNAPMALGRIEAANTLLNLAENSGTISNHPMFDGAEAVWRELSVQLAGMEVSDPAWSAVHDEMERLRQRLQASEGPAAPR